VLLGVSVDGPADNAAWKAEHKLPFPLLSDSSRAMAVAYGACADKGDSFCRRIAVLVSPEGKVERVWNQISPRKFAADLLAQLPL
jgi:thioredoxin-dependent peroxiredoxin